MNFKDLQDNRLKVLCKYPPHHVEGQVGQKQSITWNLMLSIGQRKRGQIKVNLKATRLQRSQRVIEKSSIVPGGDVGEVVGHGAKLQEVVEAGLGGHQE